MKQLSIYDFELLEVFNTCDKKETLNTINTSSHSCEKNIGLNSQSVKPASPRFNTNNETTQTINAEIDKQYPANVTEIVLANDKVDSIQLILPMLINLHQESRWLAWIDPPIQLLKAWQKKHNEKALNDVMILRSNENLSVFELSHRALSAGTCHAVIAWTNNLSTTEFTKLEAASSAGNSHGIILKSRSY